MTGSVYDVGFFFEWETRRNRSSWIGVPSFDNGKCFQSINFILLETKVGIVDIEAEKLYFIW